ncbi:unnamed protein product [Rotaria socialis]|uniref:Uncharacterized protein n=3 Tax=Rotaria socialis TaxID=392032 RepID=A0A817M311_9BILA|nr:unnamed protein product [Rotaria socialis]
MAVDIRKINNGASSTRSVYQHRHLCIRTFHLLRAYPAYSCLLLFVVYLQIMDMILYCKIRSRGPLHANAQTTSDTNLKLFASLPVKRIMVGQITQYVRSPLAEYVESDLYFTSYFPSISPNAISMFHCFLSIISIKFFSSDSLLQRRIGVLIFEFRNFLDCLDGVVFRARIKNLRYKSYRGNLGYYMDGITDVLSGICLIVGCLLHFFKQRPLRSITHKINQTLSTRMSRSSDNESEEADLIILNLDDEQKQQSTNGINSNTCETKARIIIALSILSVRYALAGMFWNREVQAYEDLLDSYINQSRRQDLQMTILHSPLTILMFYLWRYLSAISVQDYLIFAILFDRTWEFIQKTNKIGCLCLLITIFATELHIDQIRSILNLF